MGRPLRAAAGPYVTQGVGAFVRCDPRARAQWLAPWRARALDGRRRGPRTHARLLLLFSLHNEIELRVTLLPDLWQLLSPTAMQFLRSFFFLFLFFYLKEFIGFANNQLKDHPGLISILVSPGLTSSVPTPLFLHSTRALCIRLQLTRWPHPPN